MLAISTHQPTRDRLGAVVTALGLPSLRCFARAGDLPPTAAPPATILFVDLASCCDEARVVTSIQEWVTRNQAASVVLFVRLANRDCELRLLYELAAAGVGQMMTASDFDRLEVWRNVVARETLSGLQSVLRADFLDAVARAGRSIPARELVLALLADAPRISNVHDAVAEFLGQHAVRSDTCRKIASTALRRAGQLPASRLLLLFRVAWYRFLVERGWSARAIASFMGFRSPRQLRLTMRRRLTLGVREVAAQPYREVLDRVAHACSGDRGAATSLVQRTAARRR